jgi:hypothetical protein
MAISPTCQPTPPDPTIPPSLSSFAYPMLAELQPTIPTNRRQQRKRLSLVSLRNWNGDEITEILWPNNFVPFLPSLSPNEETLSTEAFSTLYSGLSDLQTNANETSYLILPPKNYSHLPSTFDDHDIQRILHKYRVKYVAEDIVDQPHFNSSLVEFDIPEDGPDDFSNDLQEVDRLSSLLSVNFDAEEDHDRNQNGRLSLDDMLSDLSNKLSYFDQDRFDIPLSVLSLCLCLCLSHCLISQEDSNPLHSSQSPHSNAAAPAPVPLPSSSHSNLYRGLAEQIYFAELDAEDFFKQWTSFELDPRDVLLVNSKTHLPVSSTPLDSSSSHLQEVEEEECNDHHNRQFELTTELAIPPNQVVGLYDRVTSSSLSSLLLLRHC